MYGCNANALPRKPFCPPTPPFGITYPPACLAVPSSSKLPLLSIRSRKGQQAK